MTKENEDHVCDKHKELAEKIAQAKEVNKLLMSIPKEMHKAIYEMITQILKAKIDFYEDIETQIDSLKKIGSKRIKINFMVFNEKKNKWKKTDKMVTLRFE